MSINYGPVWLQDDQLVIARRELHELQTLEMYVRELRTLQRKAKLVKATGRTCRETYIEATRVTAIVDRLLGLLPTDGT